MSRAFVIAAAAVLTPVAVALAVTNSEWFSGDSASAALLASDVRPARPTVGTDSSETELGVAGGLEWLRSVGILRSAQTRRCSTLMSFTSF